MKRILFVFLLSISCFVLSVECLQAQSDDSYMIDIVKGLESIKGSTIGVIAANLPGAKWFSIYYEDGQEYMGDFVGFIDKKPYMSLFYIWFVDYDNNVYYVNPIAKKLTPYLKAAPDIDPDWAYDFCKKEVADKE